MNVKDQLVLLFKEGELDVIELYEVNPTRSALSSFLYRKLLLKAPEKTDVREYLHLDGSDVEWIESIRGFIIPELKR